MIEVTAEYPGPYRATFSIKEHNFITISHAIIHLELANIFVTEQERNHGYGTVLMICALEMAIGWKLDKMDGVYNPGGDILKTEKWYKDIGADVVKKDETVWVKGNVENMYRRCQLIKSAHGLNFKVINK